MNTVLRDAFIQIHTEDVVGRLRDEFAARYSGAMYITSLKNNSVVAEKIKAWRKAQEYRGYKLPRGKAPHLDELLLERKRMRLLNSSDPAEVEQGKAIVTPTSIFQEHGDDGDRAATTDLKGTSLGNMSKQAKDTAIAEGEEMGESDDVLSAGFDDSAVADADDVTSSAQHSEESEATETVFERNLKSRQPTRAAVTPVWLPLTFPPVPTKVCCASLSHI